MKIISEIDYIKFFNLRGCMSCNSCNLSYPVNSSRLIRAYRFAGSKKKRKLIFH